MFRNLVIVPLKCQIFTHVLSNETFKSSKYFATISNISNRTEIFVFSADNLGDLFIDIFTDINTNWKNWTIQLNMHRNKSHDEKWTSARKIVRFVSHFVIFSLFSEEIYLFNQQFQPFFDEFQSINPDHERSDHWLVHSFSKIITLYFTLKKIPSSKRNEAHVYCSKSWLWMKSPADRMHCNAYYPNIIPTHECNWMVCALT